MIAPVTAPALAVQSVFTTICLRLCDLFCIVSFAASSASSVFCSGYCWFASGDVFVTILVSRSTSTSLCLREFLGVVVFTAACVRIRIRVSVCLCVFLSHNLCLCLYMRSCMR